MVGSSLEPVIKVRCYQYQRLIQCCGHGLLASAHYWQQQLDCDELLLEMNNSPVPSWHEDELTWLSFNTLSTHRCQVPEWINQVFPDPVQPIAAATAGDDQGYLVLQWPDAFSLAQLPQPKAGLEQFTQRAVICTTAQPDAGNGAIELRYFAPQYGVEEDMATGSAMRVLAHYWSRRFDRLSAWQCSPTGGQLFANFKGDRSEIGGHCVVANYD